MRTDTTGKSVIMMIKWDTLGKPVFAKQLLNTQMSKLPGNSSVK